MKNKLLCTIIFIILFTSCTPVTITSTHSEETSLPTVTISVTETPTIIQTNTPISRTPMLGVPTATLISAEGFSEPDPETWVAIMPAVREYFYFRRKAITSNNIEILWAHYPELKNEKNCNQGINCEEFRVSNYQGLKPIDGNFFPERYERIKVKIDNDKAEVYVHGMELMLWIDEVGNYQDSGGEIKIVLFMQQKNNRWVVYKTDWIQMNEINPFAP